jgi:uncharacterized protein YgiB involved in biofilm formation
MKRKRTKTISLLLMGTMSMGVSGCGTDRADADLYTFTSLAECVDSALFSEAECRQFAKDAFASTPRFAGKEDCEARFGVGACDSPSVQAAGSAAAGESGATGETRVQQGSGSFWMPMMMGFMAGRLSGGSMYGAQGLYRDPGAARQDGRSFRTGGGDTVRSDTRGRVSNPSPNVVRSMNHSAKPALGRTGGVRSGGFSGGKSFGGGAA